MAGHGSEDDLMVIVFQSRLICRDAEPVLRMVQQAWRRNTALGLTGEIRIMHGRVRQVVEGSACALLPLAAKIFADPRHTEIEVISFGSAERRDYRDWRAHGLAMTPPPQPSASSAPLQANTLASTGFLRRIA
jgi:hypothetical protein